METSFNLESFHSEVLQSSHIIFFLKNSGETNNALPDEGFGENLGDEVKNTKDLLSKSETVIGNLKIMEKLCPALILAGDNLNTICNTVVGVLIPLILAKEIELPINSMLFGAISVTVFTSSTKAVCSKYIKDEK